MAAGDLTTLLALEQYLALPGGGSDETLLAQLITAASGFIATYCGRSFQVQSYSETRDGKGTRVMPLLNTPVTAVASVTVDAVTIPPGVAVGTPAGFYFDARRVMLNGFRFCRGFGNVVIAYTAGFAATPPELQLACHELAALRFKERKHFDQRSEAGVAGQSTTFFVGDLKPSTKAVLDRYKRVALQ